jgi:hypothetical protein
MCHNELRDTGFHLKAFSFSASLEFRAVWNSNIFFPLCLQVSVVGPYLSHLNSVPTLAFFVR